MSNVLSGAVENDPKLEGLIKFEDLPYESWEVHPFLKPVFIDGIAYCHYFPTGVMGRPATTASAMVSKLHMSCIAGHQQGKQVAYGKRPDGSTITCIIAGSCYEHDEHYLDAQTNKHWRGVIVLHEVEDGCFDEMFVSLSYLKKNMEQNKIQDENVFKVVCQYAERAQKGFKKYGTTTERTDIDLFSGGSNIFKKSLWMLLFILSVSSTS